MRAELLDATKVQGAHWVLFYETDAGLSQTVGEYLRDALRVGGVAIVIATDAHRQAIEPQLRQAGIDVGAAVRGETLVWLDATDVLEALTMNGRIDRRAFRRKVGSVMRKAADTGRAIFAFGEMVGLLWEAGQVASVIELEELWNDLGEEVEYSLLCAYPASVAPDTGRRSALDQICRLHTASGRAGRGAKSRVVGTPQRIGTEFIREFAPDSRAPQGARQFVADTLRTWGHDPRVAEDAELVMSELATNAVIHAGSPFWAMVEPAAAGVRVSVQDTSIAEPQVLNCSPEDTHGRGLQLVDALSRRWGVVTADHGKTVWAEIG